MKPVIGVPLRYGHLTDKRPILYLGETVRRTLQNANAEVLTLTPPQDIDYIDTRLEDIKPLTEEEIIVINKYLDKCDGLFLPGGIKFTPYDSYILKYAIENDIPTLGICLSMQMMSCYQEEINLKKIESSINHKQEQDDILTHKVKINKDSKLYQILKEEEIEVNSFHNYCVSPNNIYNITAISEDNIIEGIEHPTNTFNIGVQWHPEISYNFDVNSKKIIDYFIQESLNYKMNKNHIYIDN